jgi:hypothetical protein
MTINCELCKHYTGGLLKFGCLKGFEEERKYSTTRASCVGYAKMTRSEQMAKHFGGYFHDSAGLKKRTTNTRRLAGSLINATADMKKVLTEAEIKAMQAAVSILDGVGRDLEIATRIAARAAKEEAQRREAKAHENRIAIARRTLPDATPADLITFCADAVAFLGAEGRAWVNEARPQLRYLDSISTERENALHAVTRLDGQTLITDSMLAAVGGFVDEMHDSNRSWRNGTWSDFMAFRQHRQQRATLTAGALL